jgi:hypothetical protein
LSLTQAIFLPSGDFLLFDGQCFSVAPLCSRSLLYKWQF